MIHQIRLLYELHTIASRKEAVTNQVLAHRGPDTAPLVPLREQQDMLIHQCWLAFSACIQAGVPIRIARAVEFRAYVPSWREAWKYAGKML